MKRLARNLGFLLAAIMTLSSLGIAPVQANRSQSSVMDKSDILCSPATLVAGEPRDELVNKAKGDSRFATIASAFQAKGYQSSAEDVFVVHVSCGASGEITAVSIPYVLKDNPKQMVASVGYWSGVWEGKSSEGLAGIEGDTAYTAENGKLKVKSKADWDKIIPPPINHAYAPDVERVLEPPSLESSNVDIQSRQISNSTLSVALSCGLYTGDTGDATYHAMYTTLGQVAFWYHQRKRWCYNGSVVSSPESYTYLTHTDGFEYHNGDTSPIDYYLVGNSGHYSKRTGIVDNCIINASGTGLVCISRAYPWVAVSGYYNGSYSWSQGH